MKQNEYLFYNTIESKNSAEIIVKTILPFFKKVNSFLDLGCGTLPRDEEFLSSTIPIPITLFLGESYQS